MRLDFRHLSILLNDIHNFRQIIFSMIDPVMHIYRYHMVFINMAIWCYDTICIDQTEITYIFYQSLRIEPIIPIQHTKISAMRNTCSNIQCGTMSTIFFFYQHICIRIQIYIFLCYNTCLINRSIIHNQYF